MKTLLRMSEYVVESINYSITFTHTNWLLSYKGKTSHAERLSYAYSLSLMEELSVQPRLAKQGLGEQAGVASLSRQPALPEAGEGLRGRAYLAHEIRVKIQ